MLTSVPQTPIIVIQMLTAQTPMGRLHALANLALLAPEQLALVSKDPFIFLSTTILTRIRFVNVKFTLYTYRCR